MCKVHKSSLQNMHHTDCSGYNIYCIKVCHGNAPMVTKQIQSMIPISPMFHSQDPRTLVKLYSTKAKLGKEKKVAQSFNRDLA